MTRKEIRKTRSRTSMVGLPGRMTRRMVNAKIVEASLSHQMLIWPKLRKTKKFSILTGLQSCR